MKEEAAGQEREDIDALLKDLSMFVRLRITTNNYLYPPRHQGK